MPRENVRNGAARRRPSPQITREDVARRVRAAWAYSSMRLPEFCEQAEISEASYARLAGTRAPNSGDEIPWSTLWRIADAAGLPRSWFSTPSIPVAIEVASESIARRGGPTDLPIFFSPSPEPLADLERHEETAPQPPRRPSKQPAAATDDAPVKRRSRQGR